jgi:hypothetical protein
MRRQSQTAESDRRNVADDKSTLSSHATQIMLTNHLIPYWHCGTIAALLRLPHPLSSILELQPDRERIRFMDRPIKLTTDR